jgi:uncharacterized protein YegP (UPF0339 family)
MKTQIAFSLLALTLSVTGCDGTQTDDPTQLDDSADGKEDAIRAGKFETFTGADGQYYFHLLAGNGQKVLQSEGYVSKEGAANGIATVQFNGQHSEAFQILQSKDGQYYFNLLAGNFEVIGTSELYATESNAERGVATVVKLVKAATRGAAATNAKFQVFLGLDGKYYFHLRAGNGEIVLQSQAYTRRASALAGTASVRANGTNAARFQVRDAADGQAYFVLIAGNGEVIGVSETYASRSNAQRGADAVLALLTTATIADAQ